MISLSDLNFFKITHTSLDKEYCLYGQEVSYSPGPFIFPLIFRLEIVLWMPKSDMKGWFICILKLNSVQLTFLFKRNANSEKYYLVSFLWFIFNFFLCLLFFIFPRVMLTFLFYSIHERQSMENLARTTDYIHHQNFEIMALLCNLRNYFLYVLVVVLCCATG